MESEYEEDKTAQGVEEFVQRTEMYFSMLYVKFQKLHGKNYQRY